MASKLEPVEEVVITVLEAHVGTVSELVGPRQAIMEHVYPDEGRGARLVYRMPTRGLIGLRGRRRPRRAGRRL